MVIISIFGRNFHHEIPRILCFSLRHYFWIRSVRFSFLSCCKCFTKIIFKKYILMIKFLYTALLKWNQFWFSNQFFLFCQMWNQRIWLHKWHFDCLQGKLLFVFRRSVCFYLNNIFLLHFYYITISNSDFFFFLAVIICFVMAGNGIIFLFMWFFQSWQQFFLQFWPLLLSKRNNSKYTVC